MISLLFSNSSDTRTKETSPQEGKRLITRQATGTRFDDVECMPKVDYWLSPSLQKDDGSIPFFNPNHCAIIIDKKQRAGFHPVLFNWLNLEWGDVQFPTLSLPRKTQNDTMMYEAALQYLITNGVLMDTAQIVWKRTPLSSPSVSELPLAPPSPAKKMKQSKKTAKKKSTEDKSLELTIVWQWYGLQGIFKVFGRFMKTNSNLILHNFSNSHYPPNILSCRECVAG